MGLFTGVGDFFRGAFGEDEEEKRRRKQREAGAAADRRVAARPQQQQQNRPAYTGMGSKLFGQKSPDPTKLKTQPKPLFQQMTEEASKSPKPPAPRPLPDKEFLDVSEGEKRQKTIFGKNAAWILPKGNEQVTKVEANKTFTTNKDKYVAGYDKLQPQKQKILVNTARQRAAQGDKAAINTLKALEETGRLKGSFSDFVEGSNERFYGGLTRGTLRTADLLLPGKNTFGLEREADRQDASKTGQRQITDTGRTGETVGTFQKGVTDIATIALPQSKIDKLAEATKVYKTLKDGSKIMQVGGKLVRVLPGSAAGTAIDYTQQRGRGDEPDLAKSIVTGTGLDLIVDSLPGGVGKLRRLFGKKGADPNVIDEIIETGVGASANAPRVLDDIARQGEQADQLTRQLEELTDEELEIVANDINTPAYQRTDARDEVAKRANDAANKIAPNTPLDDVPAFQQKQAIQDVINRETDKFNTFINQNTELTRQQIETAREATKKRITDLVEEMQANRMAGQQAVEKQADDVQQVVDNQKVVNEEVATTRAAQANPTDAVQATPAAGSPEVVSNDAYTRFNQEAGIDSNATDVRYVDAQQQLEQLAGNKEAAELTKRQKSRVPVEINQKTQGAAADFISNTAGTTTGKLLTSQNPIANFFGQTLYAFNKKSTMSNAQKSLVEQVRGRRGGIGKLREEVVANIEQPLAKLDDVSTTGAKERVYQAFELYNNGQIDESLAAIKSFTPEERAYFDGVRELNVLRNNLNKATMEPELIERYANGMHMPRIFDPAAFAKEFDENALEVYASSQNKTLDLNPNKRRKQLEELSEEMRQQMLRDPAQASAIRTEIALHNKAVSDYSASVGVLPDAVSDVPQKGFLEIPDQARFGDAAGKYVRRDLAEPMLSGDLRFKSDAYKAVNTLLDKYQSSILGKVENGLRRAITSFNPATRLGNRVANLTQGSMAGFNLPEMAIEQQHFMNVLKKGGDEWTRLAQTYGATDNAEALARFSGQVSESKTGLTKRINQSYNDTDTAAKVAMFKWQIQRGASPEDAARFVNRALPNIGNSGEIYTFFSRLPVLGIPFRAIQPEVLRALGSTMSRNTVPFVVAMATYTTLQNMSWEGVPEEERAQIQERFGAGQTPFAGINKFFGERGIPTDKVLPSSWSFNAAGVPGVENLFATDPETGERPVVDVDPRRLMGMYSINLGGDSAADSAIDAAIKASPANIPFSYNEGKVEFQPQNLVGSRVFSPLYQAAIDRDFRGKSVQSPDRDGVNVVDPETLQLKDLRDNPRRAFEYILRSYVPQATDVANIVDASKGEENFYGQKMNVPQTIARLFGLKGEQFDKERLDDMTQRENFFADDAVIKQQLEGMSPAEQEAWKRLTGTYKLDEKEPNAFGGESWKKAPVYNFSEDKWKDYASNPKLYDLMVEKKRLDNQRDGTPIQPEFDERLPMEFRRQLIQNKIAAPGDDAELDQRMYSAPEWDYYNRLKDEYEMAAKAKYGDTEFTGDDMVKHQSAKFPEKPAILKQYSAVYGNYLDGKAPKPEWNDELKAAKEVYNKQTFDWTNQERAARGLPAITWDIWNNPTFGFDESPSGSGYGFGGGGGGGSRTVDMTTDLSNFTSTVKRLDPMEAQASPNIVALFQKLRAGSGGGRAKPKLGASSSGR